MAIRKVARMGHPVLRKIARTLSKKEILSVETRNLVKDMIETMDEYGGIGIAAPQIHESVAIAIIDYEHEEEPRARKKNEKSENEDENEGDASTLRIIINPKITVLDETKQEFWEGCLSVPEIRGRVGRPRKVKIDYLDLNAESCTVVAEGFAATVFQHELDHLFGTLFIDRVEYAPGKSQISFTDEYAKYQAPLNEDDEELD